MSKHNPDFHNIHMIGNQVYLDDIPLKGVRGIRTFIEAGEMATVEIELYFNPGLPDKEDMERWTTERVVREAQFKEVMTKQVNELLEKLSEDQS